MELGFKFTCEYIPTRMSNFHGSLQIGRRFGGQSNAEDLHDWESPIERNPMRVMTRQKTLG